LHLNNKLINVSHASGRYGVSAARNIGAENAGGEIFVFLDADVILPDTYLEKLKKRFDSYYGKKEEIDGILGISATNCYFKDFFSNYKNLWMRYTYQRLKGYVGTLNTSCFAITRHAFFSSGGFDEFRRRDVEDAIYGDKLLKLGFKIIVADELEYIHKKKYNLLSAIQVDIFRSRKLTEYSFPLLFQRNKNPESSIPRNYFFGITTFYLALLLLPFGLIKIHFTFMALLLILVSPVLSADYLQYLKNIKGFSFALKAFIYQFVVFTASGIGIILGLIKAIASRNQVMQ
jgi:GT2 family glycosyltransferase